MARRKSVCAKWTLVLVSIILYPVVLSRPQENSSSISLSSILPSATDKSTEIPIRYIFRSSSGLSTFVSSVPLSFPKNFNLSLAKFTQSTNYTNTVKSRTHVNVSALKNKINNFYTLNPMANGTHKISRLITNEFSNLHIDATNKALNSVTDTPPHLNKTFPKFIHDLNYTNIVKSRTRVNVPPLKNKINNFYTLNPMANGTHKISRLITNEFSNLHVNGTYRAFKSVTDTPSHLNKTFPKFIQDSNYSDTIKSPTRVKISALKNKINNLYILNPIANETHRKSRLLTNNSNELRVYASNRAFKSVSATPSHLNKNNHLTSINFFSEKNKPIIRKVITKWTDKTKYDDLNFSTEHGNSADDDEIKYYSKEFNEYSSREDISSDLSELSKDNHPKLTKKVFYKPTPQYNQAFPTYPTNMQAMDNYHYTPTRPTYVFATPTPTPVITNVGYPPPWSQPNFQVIQPVTSQRPIKVTNPVRDHNNHHSIVNNYPQQYPTDNFEVTTFQPTSAYTDRIVIRPEEYSASPDDCPTIYLTLNNTFQGQAKEACPDLNIAVNTNVVNKNVVVESEEESDNPFADAFGIPLMDDSESVEGNNDYNDSTDDDVNTESASVESTALTNYNSNAGAQESAESGNFASPSSALSTISTPGRPSDDDDVFSFSSIVDFFRPALNAFNWLAAINPLSFGIISFILTPIAIIFAGASGLAALFAPLALSYAREAQTPLHIQYPYWLWNDESTTEHISWTDSTDWSSILENISEEPDKKEEITVKPTLFYKFKEWMKGITQKLRNENNMALNARKSMRKKRQTWSSTIK